MRNDEAKPINTKSKATGLINQLLDLIAQGQNPNLCLKHATDRCWLSIYPIKQESKAVTQSPKDKWGSLGEHEVKPVDYTIFDNALGFGDGHAQ